MTNQARTLPLHGMTVVELGHSLAAPYAGHILAQLGATVIKVEAVGKGDHARGWGAVWAADAAVMFHAINCGKRGIAADLHDPAMRDAVRRLILERADAVVQNMKAGAIERLGLDADTLRAAKPALVYANITAFGPTGPWRDKPGYDPLIQAMSGMMSLVGEPGGPPSRVPVSVNDMGSGMWSVIGILAALLARNTTGQGATIDTSLYETALAWLTVQLTDYLNAGVLPSRQGSANSNIVPYQAFACQDGHILIAAGNDGLFRKLCTAIGLPQLGTDPRFATNTDRINNRGALIPQLEARLAALPLGEAQGSLDAAGVPNGPILTLDQSATSAQAEAIGIVEATPTDGVRTVGIPLSIDRTRLPLAGDSPRLGQHTALLDAAR